MFSLHFSVVSRRFSQGFHNFLRSYPKVVTQVFTQVSPATYSRAKLSRAKPSTPGGCAIVAADVDWTSLRDAMGESHRQAYPLIFSILDCFRCIDVCWLVHVTSCVSYVARRRSMEHDLKSEIFADCLLRPLWCFSFLFFAHTVQFKMSVLFWCSVSGFDEHDLWWPFQVSSRFDLAACFCCHCCLVP